MQSLLATRPRDTNYQQLYDYFITCETTGQAPKVRRIMEILDRSETTVYTRIRRHWNEFISRNDQQARSEYIVKGLKNKCPSHYFVLAHRRNQAQYFFLFQTAIVKYNAHIARVQERKLLSQSGSISLPPLLDDGIPPQINDEGVELPEDQYPTLSDEEVEEEGDEEEEHTEDVEADLPAPQPISSAAYTIEASRHTSAYVEPTLGRQALDTVRPHTPNEHHEQQDDPSPLRAQGEAATSDPEPKPAAPNDPPTPSRKPRKRLIPALVGIALLVVVIIIIIEFLSPRIP